MSEILTSTPLLQLDDMEALRAFDEKFPEYALDSFVGSLDAVPTSQKAVQADNGPQDGQAPFGPSHEKIQWVEKNDFFNDQDVASIFENTIAGIESAIIESSMIGNHQVDLSGNAQLPLPSWALDTNRQKNAELESQVFPHDFNSFEQEHWDFYTNEILKDETLMTKEWDDLICWLNESYIKFKAEEKEAEAAKAPEERSFAKQGEKDPRLNSAPERSDSGIQLEEGGAGYAMAPPQCNSTNGAAPSPYQNTSASGEKPQVLYVGRNQDMSSQKTPCHPGLDHSQRNYNGRTPSVQVPVQQRSDPRPQIQLPHPPPTGYTTNGQYTPAIHRHTVNQCMGPPTGCANNQSTPPAQHQESAQGRNGAPRVQYQQSRGPPTGSTNNTQSKPPIQHQGSVQGMNGASRYQHQQLPGPLTGYANNSQSTSPAQHQGSARGRNGAPRVQHPQSCGPTTINPINNTQSPALAGQQGFAQGMNGTPRAQSQLLPGPLTGLINNSQSTPPIQHQGSVQGMRSTPRSQLSSLGPGGRTDRQVPRQILGRRGREAIEDDDDVVELDPSVYANQTSEDGSRSKRRRSNANHGMNTEPRPQRRQNGSTTRPQYYGPTGAPVPIVLPQELSRSTRSASGFVGNAMQPCAPSKAIDSNGRSILSTQGSQVPIQAAPDVRPSPNKQAGHDDLAAGRMSGGRTTNHASGNHLGYLQRIPRAQQAQQNPGQPRQNEHVGGLRQGTYDAQQSNGVEGQKNGNGDRRKQVQHGRNPASGPPQLLTGGLSHPAAVTHPRSPQPAGRILGEVLDDFGLEPGGDMPAKISRKRDRSQSMNEHQEESQWPEPKRRRTPSIQGSNTPPEAPCRQKGKRRKLTRDEHLPPPVFSMKDSENDASRQQGAIKAPEQIIPAKIQLPHMANAQAPNPPHNPPPTIIPPDHLHHPDIRDAPPTTEWECIRLQQALDHTRWAYEQWTGTDAPPTNRLLPYSAQFATILNAFGQWWHSDKNPEKELTMEWLVQLDPWEGGVADWKEPGKDGLWWECVRRGFYAMRDEQGGLVEPEFRWDYRDYDWFRVEDEERL